MYILAWKMQLLARKSKTYMLQWILFNVISSVYQIWAKNRLKLGKCSTWQKHSLTKIIILLLFAEVLFLVHMDFFFFCLCIIGFSLWYIQLLYVWQPITRLWRMPLLCLRKLQCLLMWMIVSVLVPFVLLGIGFGIFLIRFPFSTLLEENFQLT